MRLLYAFFDYSSQYDSQESYRNLGKCSLNFSTTHTYNVKRNTKYIDNGRTCIYTISQENKPSEERIPSGFWAEKSEREFTDDRIYNITAFVGNNGAGKSTLIHSLIKSVVKGLSPDMPFLILLQQTASDQLLLYYGKGNCGLEVQIEYGEGFPEDTPKSTYYPNELNSVKTILIDNTLSVSSIELTKKYLRYIEKVSAEKGDNSDCQGGKEDTSWREPIKQLFNKSLTASFWASLQTSERGRMDSPSNIFSMLDTHFCFETYQQMRFLFDKHHRNLLFDLIKKGYNIPYPKLVTVELNRSFFNSYELAYDVQRLEPIISHIEQTDDNHLLGQLLACAFCSLAIAVQRRFPESELSAIGIYYDLKSQAENNDEPLSNGYRIFQTIAEKIREAYKGTKKKAFSEIIIKYEQFATFLQKNCRILYSTFEQLYKPKAIYDPAVYSIDINKTIDSPMKLNCFIEFLEKYRAISDDSYFLIFSTGLSSGENNMLRMMTQLRYALDGPATYGDTYKEENTAPDVLRNKIIQIDRSILCDTVLIFLDEADLTFHPEWQRRFISILTGYLPLLYKSVYYQGAPNDAGCKDIQVFLATHSPLMLGDFPKASTIYLKKDTTTGNITKVVDQGQKSSFGENLYTLLKDGFFMEDTIGEFAKQKINEIVIWCKDVRLELQRISKKENKIRKPINQADQTTIGNRFKELDKHRRTVYLLPPGIIRNKLHAELDDCARLIDDKKEKLDLLASEKARLEKQLERINKELESLQSESVGGNNASDQ